MRMIIYPDRNTRKIYIQLEKISVLFKVKKFTTGTQGKLFRIESKLEKYSIQHKQVRKKSEKNLKIIWIFGYLFVYLQYETWARS